MRYDLIWWSTNYPPKYPPRYKARLEEDRMNESIDEFKSQQGKERFVITRKTPHHKIRISHADYVALRMWMIVPDDTIVNATHRMIGQVIKCSEEHHDKQIAYLRKKLNQ